MKYPIAALMIASCAFFNVQAQTLSLKPSAPKHYQVKEGDTLWDISKMYLQSPWRWHELWKWNKNIQNPDLIYPGDVLSLSTDAQGRPILSLDKGVKKLSPRVRVTTDKSKALPTLPLPLLEPFLRFEQALDDAVFDSSPMVLGANHNVNIITQGHILYIKGLLARGGQYAIYRRGDDYIDPQTNQKLAVQAILVGAGRAIQVGNNAQGIPAKLRLDMVKQEVKAGDILLPVSEGQSFSAQFTMQRPAHSISGSIIATSSKLREAGTMSIVVLNIGSNDKLHEGHILDVYKHSPVVIEGQKGPRYIEDATRLDKLVTSVDSWFGDGQLENSTVWTMPSEKVGEVMLFKVYQNLSYAMVIKAEKPARIGDTVQVLW
ncbi:LysM peptidoglycan-binding domain-containing protein [Pseudoalteromonas sp. T1lg65]|uniref:LysM peptidoglycan-binding domain-containing protein n=1 Tax=Pseudoalteromonas sp. T1lg65 TaxID=2077101 RepID=UPI003F7AF195